ncbi:MAG TPA: 4Fe-4S binding protein [Dehalococcoidia bacterium]|nr:4Fe-4S binding protein [Dehalococcoidia bacterium]
MSFTIIEEKCISCGACEFVCPTVAVHKPVVGAASPSFWIETNRCNDCDACAPVCPTYAIVVDPDAYVCYGKGCPVATHTTGPITGWLCTELTRFCEHCGDVLHRESEGSDWVCVQCDLGIKARCPKARKLEAEKHSRPMLQYSREDFESLTDLL